MTRLPACLLTLCLLGTAAAANTLYWGGGNANIPNGTLLSTNITALSGAWDLTTANWSTTTNGTTYTNWPSTGTSNTAYIGYGLATTPNTAFTITQTVSLALNQLIVNLPNAYDYAYVTAPSPVVLTLNGSNPTISQVIWDRRYNYLSFETNVALAGTNGLTITYGTGPWFYGATTVVKSDSSGLTGTVALVTGTGSQTLYLQNGGRLTGVNSFILPTSSGMQVIPPSASARDDLGDACAVRLQGGTFVYQGYRHATSPSTETIGSIVLDSWGMLDPSVSSGSGAKNGQLYMAIDRGPNSKGTVHVGNLNDGSEIPAALATDIIVTNYPTGVILPWMSHTRGMAMMLTPGGVITNVATTLAPRDLSTWQPNQDYRAFSSQIANDVFSNSISPDLTINSLGVQINQTNLNNQTITIGATNTLTISSGYIGIGWDSNHGTWGGYSFTITGGNLTTTTNDLYLFAAHNLYSLEIDSAITGSCNVVASSGTGGQNVTLGGATTNSYTGTTYVNGALSLRKPAGVIALSGNVDIGTLGALYVQYGEQITNAASVMNRGVFQVNNSLSQTFKNRFTNQGGSMRIGSYGSFTLQGPGTGFAFNGGQFADGNGGGSPTRLLTDVGYDASSLQQAIFSGSDGIYLADGTSATRTFNVADSTTLPAGTSEMVAGLPFGQNGAGVVANLHKTGSGVLEMTARHTYTGTNTIEAGTLLANSARSTGYGSVIVTNSGTLGGTGIVLGAVSVYSGASLMPGLSASAGTLTVSNNVNLRGGATFNVGLSSSGNGLLVCSNLTLAGYVNPNPLPGYTIPYSGTWTIATVLGAGTIDKTGATTPPGFTLKVTGSNLILNKPAMGSGVFFR